MSWFFRVALVVMALGIGLAFVLAGCNGLNLMTGSSRAGTVRVGSPAPDTEGKDVDGKPFSLNDYRGKVVLLSFWGSFCGPCRALFPHERSLEERFQGKPFALLGVCVDAGEGRAQQLQRDGSVTWRCFQDDRYEIAALYGIHYIPVAYVIDAKGVVRYAWDGSAGLDELGRKIGELIADAEVGG
jgi:peroxiredoxin